MLEMAFLGKSVIPQRGLNCFKNSSHTSQMAASALFNRKENSFRCQACDFDINSLDQVLFNGFETAPHSDSF